MSSDDVKPLTIAKPKIPASVTITGRTLISGDDTMATHHHRGTSSGGGGIHYSAPEQRFRSTLLPQRSSRGGGGGSDTRSDEGEIIVPSPPTINIPQPSRTLRDQEESFYHLTPQERFDYEQELRAGIAEMARNKRLEIIMPPPGTPLSSVKHTFDVWLPIARGETSLSIGRLVLRGLFILIDHLLKMYNINVPNFLEIQMESIGDYDSIIYSLTDQFTGGNGVAFSPMTKLGILLAINVFAVVAPTFRGLSPIVDSRQAMGVADFVKRQLDIVPEKPQRSTSSSLPHPPSLGKPTVPNVNGGMMGDLMNLIPKDPETLKRTLTAIASMVGTSQRT